VSQRGSSLDHPERAQLEHSITRLGGAIMVVTQAGRHSRGGPGKALRVLFEADHGASSACSGPCAQAWPPVVTEGAPMATGSANPALLSTITRSDGSKQVTYNGHPLYFFSGDSVSGDAKGEGSKAFGGGWYVLAPSGEKIDIS
jgi:predicted lipoprotein with Yx(FWY)xxD motif